MSRSMGKLFGLPVVTGCDFTGKARARPRARITLVVRNAWDLAGHVQYLAARIAGRHIATFREYFPHSRPVSFIISIQMASVSRSGRTVHVFSEIKSLLTELVKVCPTTKFHEIGYDAPNNEVLDQLQTAEVLITGPDLIGQYMNQMPNLKWLQLTWAGVDDLFKSINKNNPPRFTLTRFGGVFGQDLAEYAIGHIIARERKFSLTSKNQEKHIWLLPPNYRLLSKLTLGIIGCGDIGKVVARLGKAHGMTIWGMGRTPRDVPPPNVDQYRTIKDLKEMLCSCDYVCNILPSTPETTNLLSGDVLQCCENKKPVLINIGRGDVISEASLVHALKEGWISGAILDVFEEEPLRDDSELWDMSNVTITPHVAGVSFPDQVAEEFAKNLKLYEAGEPLKFVVDYTKGY